jgi:hypothetical protein
MKSFFIPGWWIMFSPGTHLIADGKRYPLIGTENITPGTKFKMPKKGEPNEGVAEYKLFFAPLPDSAKECSMVEGDTRGSFNFLHIDLTGKPGEPWRAPKIKSQTLPAPSFDSGKARVEFVLGCSLEGLPKMDASLYCTDLFPLNQEVYSARFDDSGTAVFEFWLNGTGRCWGWIDEGNAYTGEFFVEPGGTVRVYLDGSSRHKTIKHLELDESAPLRLRFGGSYADLNNAITSNLYSKYSLAIFGKEFASEAKNGEDYYHAVKDSLERRIIAIASDNSLSPLGRSACRIAIIADACDAILVADHIRRFRGKEAVSVPDEAYEWLGGFALDSPDMVFSGHTCSNLGAQALLPYSCPGGEGYLAELPAALPLMEKARHGESLTEDEIARTESFKTPLLSKGIHHAQESYSEAMAELPQGVSSFPDLPPEHILDTILERYKGKTVLLTVWATWHLQCTQSIRHLDGDKKSRFKDVAFVYITGTTSPRDKWLSMIPEIQGEHYYLDDKQIESILKELDSNEYNTYLLVAPDGTRVYSRIDWHDKIRDKLINTLKKYN